MPVLRIDKLIADSGLYSRSEAAVLLRRGSVTAGGQVIRSGAEKIDTDTVSVAIDGKPLIYKRFMYIMLNKPQGYVSSTKDEREKTVMELLDDKYVRLGLFPAGRLDKDAEGLLLLTNDGELAHRIMSPSGNVVKSYFVEIDGDISEDDIKTFAQGISLGDGTKCRPAVLEATPGGAFVILKEGKYHQVKRMMAARGKRVKYLRRVAIGGLELDQQLRPGEYRELNDEILRVFE